MTRSATHVPAVRRAAAYVRMSTDQQTGSIGYQLDFIGRYAAATNWQVTKVYRDEGRSGVRLTGRDALQQLLADIAEGDPGFQAVLVYDVSRWGRFQDVDESGFYEHLCRRSGIAVLYCAEHFANDGSPLAHIMKSVKRTMAAEYSRELSERAVRAHAFFLARGFKPGGSAGYGLRRLCVRANGEPRRILPDGEQKGHPTDHVVLVPGPDDEIAVVRRLYQLYLDGYSFRALARLLNDEGIRYGAGKEWRDAHVKQVLTNEKYCGNLLYRRTTQQIGAGRGVLPATQWMRKDGAISPLVTVDQFEAVVRERLLRRGLDGNAVLERLRALFEQHGRLSSRLINAKGNGLRSERVQRVFGSLHRAYVLALDPLAGVPSGFRWKAAAVHQQRELCTRLQAMIAASGRQVARIGNSCVLRCDDGLTVRAALAGLRCRGKRNWGWNVPVVTTPPAQFVLCGLLDESAEIVGYVLLATAEHKCRHIWLRRSSLGLSGVRLATEVEELFT